MRDSRVRPVAAISVAVALASCAVPSERPDPKLVGADSGPGELEPASRAEGEIRIRFVWPADWRSVAVIPSRTAKFQVTVTGPGISSPVAQTVTREAGAAETVARIYVPAGSDRTATVEAQDSGGAVLAKGSASGIKIESGRYTPVTVTLAWLVGHVSGRVLDAETDKGVAGVTVSAGGTTRSAQTDADGKYLVEDVPTGTRELTLAKEGYQTSGVKTNVSIGAGTTAQAADLTINPSHWFLQLSGVSTDLNAVHFVNSYAGWAAGDKGVVLKTVDAGQNWTEQITPTGRDLSDIAFLDEQVGWSVGLSEAVLKTSDGGLNWAQVDNLPSSGVYDQLCLSLSSEQIFLGGGSYYGSVRSRDGGATWQKLEGLARRVFFISKDRGWRVDTSGSLWFTSTGGQSWSGQVTPGGTGAVKDLAFKDDVTGWAATNLGHILRTANGGASWTVFGQAPGAINRFAFADDSVGFGIASDGVVYRTADGGKTWVTQALAASLTTDLYDLDVKSPTLAWAVGEGGRVFKY